MSDEHCMKFGPAAFLASVGLGRRVVEFQAEECFFTQGDPADSIFVLQRGRAKLAVVSEKGKQATISLLFPGDLFGEEALAAKPVYNQPCCICLHGAQNHPGRDEPRAA